MLSQLRCLVCVPHELRLGTGYVSAGGVCRMGVGRIAVHDCRMVNLRWTRGDVFEVSLKLTGAENCINRYTLHRGARQSPENTSQPPPTLVTCVNFWTMSNPPFISYNGGMGQRSGFLLIKKLIDTSLEFWTLSPLNRNFHTLSIYS